MRKYPYLYKSMVYKRRKHTKINRHFHTSMEEGKYAHKIARAHACTHTPRIALHTMPLKSTHVHRLTLTVAL